MSSSVSALITQAAQNAGVDPRLALEVATIESSLNANPPDGQAGEIGTFQVEPATGAQYGFSVAQLRDPAQNILAGVTILAALLSAFGGDPISAVAAYNCGQGCVQHAQANYGSAWFSRIPSSTQSYVAEVLGNVQTQYSAAVNPTPFVTGATLNLQPNLPPAPAGASIWATLAIAAAVLLGLGFALSE